MNKKTGWVPAIRTQRVLALILLICQGAITVTGAVVRVTGSGLGCDTWPNCQEGSLTPVAGAAPAIHQAIEFGNRMLTFVLVAAMVAVLAAVLAAHRRTEIIWYTLAAGIGIILQAVIGGISVHLDLQWWAVALHFLPSMVLVWLAAIEYVRIGQPDDGDRVNTFPTVTRLLAIVSTVALCLVLVTGTMTTGAGPHSGDDGVGMEGRLEVDIDWMAHIHGWLMYVYLIATLIFVWQLYRRRDQVPARAIRYGMVLILMILIQGGIGIAQYNLGVPRWTVPLHIGMCSIVVAIAGIIYGYGLIRRGGTASATGSLIGDEKLLARTQS